MIQCPQCGQLNEPFFKFCLMCGATISGGVAVAQKPSRPAEPVKPAEPAKPAEPVKVAAPVKAEPPVAEPTPLADVASHDLARAATEPAMAAGGTEPADAPVEAATEAPNEPVTEAPAEPALGSSEPPASEEPAVDDAPASDAPSADELPAAEAPVAESPVAEAPAADVSVVDAPTQEAMKAADPDPAPRAAAVSGPDDDEELGESVSARAPEPKASGAKGGRRRTRYTLVVIRDDASDGEKVALDEGIFTVGREGSQLEFPEDVYMDALHASFEITANGVTVLDQGTVNGVFTQVHTATPLGSGGEIRLGQQLLRFEEIDAVGSIAPSRDGSELLGAPLPAGVWGRLVEVVGPDFESAAYLLDGNSATLGRDRGDITFPDDGYVSGTHARLFREGDKTLIEDLGSSNGTYVRTQGPTALKPGVMLLMGQQLFRLDG